MLVDTSTTLAPGRGSPVWASRTVPSIVEFTAEIASGLKSSERRSGMLAAGGILLDIEISSC